MYVQVANLAALKHFKIPKVPKRKADDDGQQTTFPTTTPGAGTSSNTGPELIKKARTMRFEGQFDKGGIGQQLVLAGFHQMNIGYVAEYNVIKRYSRNLFLNFLNSEKG